MGPFSRRFEHRTLKTNPPLVGSYCRACGAFVGASGGPATLKLAEKAHACPQKPSRVRRADRRRTEK